MLQYDTEVEDADPVYAPVYMALLLGAVLLLAFLASLIFVCWWNACRRPLINEDKAQCGPGLGLAFRSSLSVLFLSLVGHRLVLCVSSLCP